MSALKDLIRQSKATRAELVASTVRLPPNLNDFIEDFAEQHSKSKQEILLLMLQEGVSVAESELREEEKALIQKECAFQLLNTNRRHSVKDHETMLSEGIAAAYYDPWKRNIDKIFEGDIVFLYENGVGVVAYGTAKGCTLKREYNNNADDCYYKKLDPFVVLDKPVHAREIKKILGRSVVFLRTMSAMPDGDKLLAVLNQNTAIDSPKVLMKDQEKK